jgi:hypothetical protein
MPTANEYLKKAEECYRLASEAKTETDRLACLELARTWIEAAYHEQDEARKPVNPAESKAHPPPERH